MVRTGAVAPTVVSLAAALCLPSGALGAAPVKELSAAFVAGDEAPPPAPAKAAYANESWPEAPLYVWAHPGKSGTKRRRGGLDPTDPANWLVGGEPPLKVELGESADILLPRSDERYTVGFRGTDIREVCRHVTIESGAAFVGGGDGVGRAIHGNVWVKAGGGMDSQGATSLVGPKHTFFRNDNTVDTAQHLGRGGGIMSSQYFVFKKEKDGRGKAATVEFVGHVSMLDEFRIIGCTVIVGPDSRLEPGRNAHPYLADGGRLALLDGAYFGVWQNNFGTVDLTADGAVLGGLPERPLTRNCTFGVHFKNHAKATPPGEVSEKLKIRHLGRVPGVVFKPGSSLRTYAAEPRPGEEKARLVVKWAGFIKASIRPEPGSGHEEKELKRWPGKAEQFKWFDSLPRLIDVWFGKGCVVDGVEFDHVRKGGLMLEDPADRRGWKDVSFGKNCAASGDALFSRADKLTRSGGY